MLMYGLRRGLHLLIRSVMVHKVATAVFLVLSLAALTLGVGRVSFLGNLSSAQAFSPAAVVPTSGSGAPVAPAPATEQYLRGSQQFDAKLIWDSLSDDVRSTAETRGEDLTSLQNRLNQTKEAGGQVQQIRYIGGFVPDAGDALYFYVVTMQNPTVGPDAHHIFYVFTVGEDGKIKDIQ